MVLDTFNVDISNPWLAYHSIDPDVVRDGGSATVVLTFTELVRSNSVNLFYVHPESGRVNLLPGSVEQCIANSDATADELGADNLPTVNVASSFVCSITTPAGTAYQSEYDLEVNVVDFPGNSTSVALETTKLRFDQSRPVVAISNLNSPRAT